MGSITVPASSRGTWRVQWDIGTIDRDPKLSDHWFCRDEYEREFIQLLRWAVQKAGPPSFEVPCATLRWGSAKGMRRELAVDFAHHVLALWEQILTDWEARPA